MPTLKNLPKTEANTFIVIHSPEANKGIIHLDWEDNSTTAELIEFAILRAILFADENDSGEVTYTIIDRRKIP